MDAFKPGLQYGLHNALPGFHPVGGPGSFPPPPKKEREKEEKRKRREREVHGGEGEHVYFCVALQVISIVSYFMTQYYAIPQ